MLGIDHKDFLSKPMEMNILRSLNSCTRNRKTRLKEMCTEDILLSFLEDPSSDLEVGDGVL
jgi:hypothetical protein